MRRGQASITVAEAAVGVLLVASLTFGFALGLPGEGETTQAQLDLYASDATTLLTEEGPRHGEQTRLSEVIASESAFERERAELERRVGRILPANIMFQIETQYGTVGSPLPDAVPTGESTVSTANGAVTLRVWYA